MRVKVKLRELVDAKAEFVSLVPRGANRIPYRIVKKAKDQDMPIDLSSFRQLLKKSEANKPTPVISGIVVIKGDETQFAAVKAAVAANGFSTETLVDKDGGTVMFVQQEQPEDGSSLVRLSDNTVLVVKGFESYAEACKAASDFDQALSGADFTQGIYAALTALGNQVHAAVQKGEGDVSAQVAGLITKFQGYVTPVVSGLPATAFKLDSSISAALKAACPPGKNMDDAEDDPAQGGDGGKDEDEENKAKKAAADASAADAGGRGEPAKKDDAVVTPPVVEDPTAKVAEKVLAVVTPQIEALTGLITKLGETVAATQAQATAAVAKAEATAATVKGTTLVGTQKNDRPAADEGDAASAHNDALFADISDTALSGRRNRYNK